MDQIMDRDMEQGLQGEGQEAAAQETMESMMEQYDISGLRKGDVRTLPKIGRASCRERV